MEGSLRSMGIWGAGNGEWPALTLDSAGRAGVFGTDVLESATAGHPAVAPVAFRV
jgi:hypothetical protein